MKRLLTFALLWFISSANLFAQHEFQLEIIAPPPNQLEVADLWQISITGFSETPAPAQIRGVVQSEADGLVLEAFTAMFELEPGSVSMLLSARDAEPIDIQTLDSRYEEIVLRTGGAPAGSYLYCAELLHAESGDIIAEDCIEIMVDPANPPEIIVPADGDEVADPYPVFSWLDASPPTLAYMLQMYQLEEGQSPAEAIAANPVWFGQEGITETIVQYPVDAPSLETAAYVVQVTGTIGGFEIIASEPVVFFYDAETAEVPDAITLSEEQTQTEPDDGEDPDIISTYSWQDERYPESLPEGAYYSLRMVMFDEDTHPGDAIAQNPPVFEVPTTQNRSVQVSSAEQELEPGMYAAQVSRTDADGEVMESNVLVSTFTEASVLPCATSDIKGQINSKVEVIKDDICDDKHAFMDELLAALSDYQDKQMEVDALQGQLDAANEMRDQLQEFADHATNSIQAEMDAMQAEADACEDEWEQQFHDRYVANASVGGTQAAKQRRFESASRVAQRRFESRLQADMNRLQDRLDRVNDHYDRLTSSLDDQISDLEDAHEDAAQEAADALANVMDLFNQIKDNLCGLEVEWEELFAFMFDNFPCIDCEGMIMPVPPVFVQMEDCLRDLFAKLADWKANIQQPGDQEALQDEADNHFDRSAAMDLLDELKDAQAELDQAIEDFNNAGNASQIMNMACGRAQTFASGGRSFGQFTGPSGFGNAKYGNSGITKIFGHNATGAYGPDSRERREARRERNDFLRNMSDTRRQITRASARLSNGFNATGKESGFADPESVSKHGAAAAVPHHQATADMLNDLIDQMLDELRDCYDVADIHEYRYRYNRVMEACVDFQEALRDLDEQYGEHADKTSRAEAILRARLAQLMADLERLKGNAGRSGSAVTDLEEKIRELEEELGELRREPVHGDDRSEKDDAISEIEDRIEELRVRLREARDSQREAERRIAELERLLERLRRGLEDYGDITPPSPLSDADEVDEASEDIEAEREEKERRAGELGDLAGEAEDLADEAGGAIGDASRKAGNGQREGRSISGDISGTINHLRRLARARAEQQLLREKAECLRILEEYRIANEEEEQGVIGRIWDSLWGAADIIDEFPEDLIDEVDQLKEYIDKVREVRGQVERILTILRGIDIDDPDARAKAFGEVLGIAEDLAGRVPGFGDIIGFYATAYNEALGAIEAIAEQLREPAQNAIDDFNVRCDPEGWAGKSLEEILDEEFDRFWNAYGSIAFARLSPSEQRRMRGYFDSKVTSDIIDCCIEKMMNG